MVAERVQRIVDGEPPVLHLEPEAPTGSWPLTVDGLVEHSHQMSAADLRGCSPTMRCLDLHCVWGWSQMAGRWEGITLDDLAQPLSTARFVLVSARSSPYASCFTLQEAREGIFAWGLDGRELPRERGGPLRFVPPPHKWAYKAVKWVERITFLDQFRPGFWEERTGDPVGTIPWDVLQRFQIQSDRWRSA